MARSIAEDRAEKQAKKLAEAGLGGEDAEGAGSTWSEHLGIRVTPGLTNGKHVAQLIKINCVKNDKFSGFTVATEWTCSDGSSGTLLLKLPNDPNMKWLTQKNLALVNTILRAAGMAKCKEPAWSEVPTTLRNDWFKIGISLNQGRYYNLDTIEARAARPAAAPPRPNPVTPQDDALDGTQDDGQVEGEVGDQDDTQAEAPDCTETETETKSKGKVVDLDIE